MSVDRQRVGWLAAELVIAVGGGICGCPHACGLDDGAHRLAPRPDSLAGRKALWLHAAAQAYPRDPWTSTLDARQAAAWAHDQGASTNGLGDRLVGELRAVQLALEGLDFARRVTVAERDRLIRAAHAAGVAYSVIAPVARLRQRQVARICTAPSPPAPAT